jgi:hypothetical protein
VFTINGFEEQEAKGFLDLQLKATGLESATMDDNTWSAIYEASVMLNMHEANTKQKGCCSCLVM